MRLRRRINRKRFFKMGVLDFFRKRKTKEEEAAEEGRKLIVGGLKTSKDVGEETESTKFDEFGQIIEGSGKQENESLGEGYYRENGKEFLDLLSPDGKTSQKVEVEPSVIHDFNNRFISRMAKMGLTKLPAESSSNLLFREGVSPYATFEGKSHKFVGCKLDLGNGKEMVFMDKRLPVGEKIMISFHELVHAR
jgi:hypothetical protein